MVSMQYLPFWFVRKMLLPRPSLWWRFIFVPLSNFSTHYWNYNWLCWTVVPSIIKTHQSDKPILDVKTKFICYGLWAALVHSVGLHVNSVGWKLQLLTVLLLFHKKVLMWQFYELLTPGLQFRQMRLKNRHKVHFLQGTRSIFLSRDQPGIILNDCFLQLFFCCHVFIIISLFYIDHNISSPTVFLTLFYPISAGSSTSFTLAHTFCSFLPLRLFLWPTVVRHHHVFPIMLSSHHEVNPQLEI